MHMNSLLDLSYAHIFFIQQAVFFIFADICFTVEKLLSLDSIYLSFLFVSFSGFKDILIPKYPFWNDLSLENGCFSFNKKTILSL